MTLLTDTELSKDQRETLRIGELCAEQLRLLIDDILDLMRLEENKVQLEQEELPLQQTLEESVEIIMFAAEQKEIEIVCNCTLDINCDRFIGDARRFRQIVMNLLSNAVKFSHRGGEVVLRTQIQKIENDMDTDSNLYEVTVSVEDHGIGIAKSAREKLFKPFVQADASTTRKFGGSGLGLSICKRLVDLMNGRIFFQSEEGHGSTFTFVLPLRQHSSDHSMCCQLPKEETCSAVLVIDPSQELRKAACSQLRYWGFSPFPFASIDEAVKNQSQWHCSDTKKPVALVNSKELNNITRISNIANIIILRCTAASLHDTFPILKKPINSRLLYNTLKTAAYAVDQKTQTETQIQRQDNQHPEAILIAEDNHMNQIVITKFLEGFGYRNIAIVDNGRKAVEAAKKNKFDIILMDCMMPEMGGIEATEIIRKQQGTQPIIIGLTANVMEGNTERCHQAGMNAVLHKPIQKAKLKEKLQQFIQGTIV
jgi:CheY-like chemotaxis protein